MDPIEIAGWGNYPRTQALVLEPHSTEELTRIPELRKPVIARGAGRSYGDASLGRHMVVMHKLDRTIHFDRGTGLYTCEAGKMLHQVLNECVPQGFFLPVTPGTKFITVGGAIAADVHGKNHHVDGCFSDHLVQFRLLTADGQIRICSRQEHPDLFWATVGGMGLTGFILDACFVLRPISTDRIVRRVIKCPDLRTLVHHLDRYDDYTYSVAWIDCSTTGRHMGRGILNLGEHATAEEADPAQMKAYRAPRPLADIPFDLPDWTLNQLTVKTFNALFYAKERHVDHSSVTALEPFFYPLDAIGKWNRLYGRQGFVQYQFVIPMEHADKGLHSIMQTIAQSGESSFLAVLKLFGEQNKGWMSFPKRGVTLALDFRANSRTFALLQRLDRMVEEMDGRLYLAKDARMSRRLLEKGYPQLAQFQALLSNMDPQGKFRSLQSVRLGIT